MICLNWFATALLMSVASGEPAVSDEAAVSGEIAATDEIQQRVAHGGTDRQSISLNGDWWFQRDGAGDQWKTVNVPSSFEMHEGTDFDGVGWYRRELPSLSLRPDQRAILRFHGVATRAVVWCTSRQREQQQVGEHLGGWTPFDCDITEHFNDSGGPVEIKLRVDELPGHNSQGFLPVFAPHFGGIWQDVELLVVSDLHLDDLSVHSAGDRRKSTVRIQCSVLGSPQVEAKSKNAKLAVSIRERKGGGDWLFLGEMSSQQTRAERPQDSVVWHFDGELPVQNPKSWHPEQPNLYDVRLQLLVDGERRDQIESRCAFRDIEVRGDQLLLNGQPLQVRGILNWGYAPPDVCPSRDPAFWNQEVALLQSYGFNLMKFCLWVPPRGYLELADEKGILTWMEYPTWHSQWTKERQPELEREFTEFFEYDRNHPSIVLRSLTCETGPSADLTVIRSLYDRCHSMIPGSVVEDDSSWIEWNRVHDFYDDHPYGNNHTWPATLDRLNTYVKDHGVKPLVLGEAIAADTWADPESLLKGLGTERPFWLPGFLDDNIRWLSDWSRLAGPESVSRVQSDSLRYALQMRKYQIEKFRQRVPSGGYVVSVIRDFPFAGMGLLDFQSQPKWNSEDWSWHGESVLILQTPNDRRGFFGGQDLPYSVLLSHFGTTQWNDGVLTVSVDNQVIHRTRLAPVESGGVSVLLDSSIGLPSVSKPVRQTIRIRLDQQGLSTENSWDLWVLPRPELPRISAVELHSSVPDSFGWMADVLNKKSASTTDSAVSPDLQQTAQVTIASKLDAELLVQLNDGARVLLLPGDGPGSLPKHQQWFLRGGPVFGSHPILTQVPPDVLLDLQHFDLGDSVVSDLQWLEQIDPIMMLWDNHDIKRVKTHGLLFETGVGQGRLMVCALNTAKPDNEAGVWLLDQLVRELSSDRISRQTLSSQQLQGMKNKLIERKIDLTTREWKFHTDPQNQGLLLKWQFRELEDADGWKPMSIGKHWEGLGYEDLDGWAWYRIEVDLDDSWDQQPVHLWIEGADDFYELYVNGFFYGAVGDIASKQTAFEERRSFDVTDSVGPDGKLSISIRVYDWYGAGGLFRPIHISTTPLSSEASILN